MNHVLKNPPESEPINLSSTGSSHVRYADICQRKAAARFAIESGLVMF